MSPLSMARKLAVVAKALYRVVSTGLKICPISGCSFMPNFPNFLFSTMSSVLSRTSSLVHCGHGDFQRRQIGCSCFADDFASACFRSASQDIPTPSCQQSFLFKFLLTQRSRPRAQDISSHSRSTLMVCGCATMTSRCDLLLSQRASAHGTRRR